MTSKRKQGKLRRWSRKISRRADIRHAGQHKRWKWIALGIFHDPAAMFRHLLKELYPAKHIDRMLDESPFIKMLKTNT